MVKQIGQLIDARFQTFETVIKAEINAVEDRVTKNLRAEIKASEERVTQKLTKKLQAVEDKLDGKLNNHGKRIEKLERHTGITSPHT